MDVRFWDDSIPKMKSEDVSVHLRKCYGSSHGRLKALAGCR